MKKLSRGLLVSIEGIDGAGKSTLIKNLVNKLEHDGFPLVQTKEPGSTQLGAVIRSLVQKKDVPIEPKAEFLLFAADRAQHFYEVVLPALAAHKLVISDRMADSSLVYQGYGRGLDLKTLDTINRWAMQNRQPDVTLYIELTREQAQKRLLQRAEQLTSFEQEKADFTNKLIFGFQELFANNPRVITLDGTADPATLTDNAYTALVQWINKHNLVI